MRFIRTSLPISENRCIFYIISEYSFASCPSISNGNFYLLINYLSLAIDINGYICDFFGLCPLAHMKPTDRVPAITAKNLVHIDPDSSKDWEQGISYSVRLDYSWPLTMNAQSLCVGDPDFDYAEVIECLPGCLIALNGEQQLKALWIKIQYKEGC